MLVLLFFDLGGRGLYKVEFGVVGRVLGLHEEALLDGVFVVEVLRGSGWDRGAVGWGGRHGVVEKYHGCRQEEDWSG